MALAASTTRAAERTRANDLSEPSLDELITHEGVRQLTPVERIVRRLAAVVFSAFYASIPWYTWRPRSFKDAFGYLRQVEELRMAAEPIDLERLISLDYVFSEPLWRLALSTLDVTDNGLDVLSVITFFVILTYTSYLFVRANPWLVGFLMFNPAVVDLVVAQSRSALASAVALLAASSKRRTISLLLVAAACLIHSLAFWFLMTFCLAKLLERMQHKMSYVTLSWAAILLGTVVAAVIAMSYSVVLQAVEDRRAFVDRSGGNTIAYTCYWVLLAMAFSVTPRIKNVIRWNDFYAIIMMVTPLTMTFFSVSTVRLAPLTLPIIIECMSARPKLIRMYLATSLIAYQILHYGYWFG